MKTTLILLTTIAALVSGCAAALVFRYNYYVVVENTGREPVPDCEVTSATGFWHQPGYLGPGFDKSIAGPFKQPYADKWTVSWETAKGQKFKKTLDLTKAFSKPFEGHLVFTIDATNGLSFHTTKMAGR